MIQLSSFLWAMVILFAFIGFLRGATREFISLAGVVLALFILEQLRGVVFSPFIGGASLAQQFYIYAVLMLAIAFFAYQSPSTFLRSQNRRSEGRQSLQEGLLGALIGGFNAYLLFGALWYYMDNLGYPLSPDIMAPPLDSASAVMVQQLPLVWLLEGQLLTVLMIVLVLFVFVAVI